MIVRHVVYVVSVSLALPFLVGLRLAGALEEWLYDHAICRFRKWAYREQYVRGA